MKNLNKMLDVFLLRRNCIIFFMMIFMSGCSTMPDALNPVEWYKGARDALTGDSVKEEKEQGKSEIEPGVDKGNNGFAKLSSVPARPKVLDQKDRESITEGLVADQDASRKYSNEVNRQKRRKSSEANAKVEPKTAQKKAEELSKPIVRRPLSRPQPLTSSRYLVPPKPVDLSSLQSKTKSQVKKRKPLVLQKTRTSASSTLKKLPSFNPNPPQIGVVPGLDLELDQSEIIVISGSGVEIMNSNGDRGETTFKLPPSRLAYSSLNIRKNLKKSNSQNSSYQVATIQFKNGSSNVGKRDRRVLRQVVAQFKKTGGRLRIIGHASQRTGTNDPILHKMTNFQVSAARAERVAKEFQKMGIKSDKLFIISVSDREPRYHEYMPSGEAGNRRAEIFIDFL